MNELPKTISLNAADLASVLVAVESLAAHISALHSSLYGLCTLIGATVNAAESGALTSPKAITEVLLKGAPLCLASTPDAMEALTYMLTHPGFTRPPNGGLHLKIVRSNEGERKAA